VNDKFSAYLTKCCGDTAGVANDLEVAWRVPEAESLIGRLSRGEKPSAAQNELEFGGSKLGNNDWLLLL
jgi:hypothetical protein